GRLRSPLGFRSGTETQPSRKKMGWRALSGTTPALARRARLRRHVVDGTLSAAGEGARRRAYRRMPARARPADREHGRRRSGDRAGRQIARCRSALLRLQSARAVHAGCRCDSQRTLSSRSPGAVGEVSSAARAGGNRSEGRHRLVRECNLRQQPRPRARADALPAVLRHSRRALYSLQKGPPERELAALPQGSPIIDLSPHIANFADTAAALPHLPLMLLT